jgi:hypothetical protein
VAEQDCAPVPAVVIMELQRKEYPAVLVSCSRTRLAVTLPTHPVYSKASRRTRLSTSSMGA